MLLVNRNGKLRRLIHNTGGLQRVLQRCLPKQTDSLDWFRFIDLAGEQKNMRDEVGARRQSRGASWLSQREGALHRLHQCSENLLIVKCVRVKASNCLEVLLREALPFSLTPECPTEHHKPKVASNGPSAKRPTRERVQSQHPEMPRCQLVIVRVALLDNGKFSTSGRNAWLIRWCSNRCGKREKRELWGGHRLTLVTVPDGWSMMRTTQT